MKTKSKESSRNRKNIGRILWTIKIAFQLKFTRINLRYNTQKLKSKENHR